MHQSIWKLTALAVVVGIGILVVIQAQHGINSRQQDDADEKQASDSKAGDEAGETSPLNSPLVPPPGESDLSQLDEDLAVPASAKTLAGTAARTRTLAVTEDDSLDFDKDSFSLESRPAKTPPRAAGASPRLNAGGPPPRINPSTASKPPARKNPLEDIDLTELSTDEDLLEDRESSKKSTTTTDRSATKSPALRLTPLDDETDETDNGSTLTADNLEPDPPRALKTNQRAAPKLMPVLNEEEDDVEQPASSDEDATESASKSTPSPISGNRPREASRETSRDDDFPALKDDPADSSARAPSARKVTPIPADDESDLSNQDEMPLGKRAPPQRRIPSSSLPDAVDKGRDEPSTDEEDDAADFPSASRTPAGKIARESEEKGVDIIDRDSARDSIDLIPHDERPSTRPGTRRPAVDDEDSISVSGRSTSADQPETARPKADPDEDDASFHNGPTREDPAPARMGSSVPVPAMIDDDAKFQGSPPRSDRPTVRNADPAPKITIEKIAPPTAVLGQSMVYQIVVRNVGDIPARQVVVEEETQSGVKVQGSIPQAMLDGGKLIWKLGTLDPGKERKIAVKVIPQSEGTIGAAATVRTARGNIDDEPVASRTRSPSLKFEVEAPRQASIGTPIPFRFKVKNVGRTIANGVVIRDVLPAGLRHPDGDDLEYEIGSLAAGEARDVELMLTAAQPGRTVNRAVVTADGNVTEEASVSLDVVGPTLNVSRAGPKRLFPNKAGHFTNTVTNPGSTPALNVRVVETVPPGMDFVEASDGGEYNAARRSITWTFDRLESNEKKSVRSRLQPNGRGAQVSVVRTHDATGGTGETVGTTHVSGLPALTIDVTDISPNVEVGEEVRVPVRIFNRGSDGATNIRATITLPSGMELISARGPVDYTSRAIGANDRAQSRTFKEQQELQFAPIARLEPRADAVIELVLKARRTGNARLQVAVECEEISEPVRREEVVPVAALAE